MVTACLCDVVALIALRLGMPVDGVWSTNSAEELLRIASMQATSCRYETKNSESCFGSGLIHFQLTLFLSYNTCE